MTGEPFVAAAQANEASIKVRKSGAGNVKEVKLGLNKAVVVDLPADAQDILVADPTVADAVTRTSRRIYIFGKAVGQTNIFVFGQNGKQIVSLDLAVERDITGLQRQLARFIPDSDIHVEIISDNIVLTGTVRTPQDASRASQLAEIFLKGGEATTRNITAVGDGGDAAIFAEQRQVSQIINLIDIEGEDQVTLKVTVAEVSRQILKQLGFNTYFTGSSGGTAFSSINPVGLGKALSNTSGLSQFNLGDYSIQAYVRAMEQAGVMKTLAEPTLTAISGERATFFVGGEFQLVTGQSVDSNTGTITYSYEAKEWGISLAFTPVVLSAGRISLRVLTTVSEPTFEGSVSLSGANGLGGVTVNGVRRREADTAVELPSGGSIVIAGLVRDDLRQVMGGFPGLSKVPVLGTLFRSRDFVRNETELVIIATPYLVRPVARNKLARPDDNLNATSDGAANFLGRVNRVYGQMETDLPPGRYHGVVGFIYKC
ncbi:type II and III secretion system protein family protein [Nitratireductor sp. XY-223]|uniref:type II and III secretion system protein family protein n=1 Tax=Nitratireductor sp. XY-223 TaxID=2561926 RepID=UPI0010AB3EB6|nr:type II and III secretion system protein family protein [Nitratireductor sp. XY-223]